MNLWGKVNRNNPSMTGTSFHPGKNFLHSVHIIFILSNLLIHFSAIKIGIISLNMLNILRRIKCKNNKPNTRYKLYTVFLLILIVQKSKGQLILGRKRGVVDRSSDWCANETTTKNTSSVF